MAWHRWGGLFVLWATAALAEGKPALIVFELEAKGSIPLQAQAATQGVVRGLRELDVFQVLSADDVKNLLAIERTRQLLGDGQGSNGLVEISKSLGARHAVVGSVTRIGDKLSVEIRLMDTEAQKVLNQKTLPPVAGMEQVANEITAMAQQLVAPLLLEQQGSLTVQSSEHGSEVLVDGNLVGSTPMREAVALPRGQHRVQVRKDGFIDQSRPVRIEPKQASTETFLLMPSPDYAEAWKIRHGRLRTGAYIATGALVASLVGEYFVVSDLSNTYVNEFVPRQAALRNATLPAQYSYVNPASALYLYNACGADPVACKATASHYQTQLIAEYATGITLGVVAAAAAVVGGYLWLTGEDPNRYMKLVASLTPQGGEFALLARF